MVEAAPPKLSYTLSSSSALSDDYILAEDVLIDLQSASPLALFQQGDESHALLIRADGALCHLQPAQGVGTWAMAEVGTAAGVTQVAAGIQMDGKAHGFYTDASGLHHVAFSDGPDPGWSAPQSFPSCASLATASNLVTGELVAYGVDAAGALVLLREGRDGTWTANSLPVGPALVGTKPVLLPIDAQGNWVMAVPGTASSGGQVDLYQGTPTALESGPLAIATPNPVSAVLSGLWMQESAVFLFTDDQGGLYANAGSTANPVRVPNTVVSRATAVFDLEGMIHLYVIDPDGRLSVVHQTDWVDDPAGPVFAPRIPLDLGLLGVCGDPSPLGAPALLAHDGEGALWSYTQEAKGGAWTIAQVQTTGTAGCYRVPQYRTEITVVDESGTPGTGLAIGVRASEATSVLARGTHQRVGPLQEATVTTDSQGKVTLSTVARGVDAPQFTFTAPGLTAGDPVNAADRLHAYLSGTGTLNAGTSTALPQFGAETLQNAQVAGGALAPAAAKNPDLARAASQGISELLQTRVKGAEKATLTSVGFELDLTDPSRPSFTRFSTPEELRSRREAAFGLSSWWDSIAGFFEDVWQGIKSGAMSIANWIVDTANQVVSFTVEVGEEVHHIVNQAIAGIKQVASLVQSVFAAIGALISKLIDWLKMLFDWSAIKDTMEALSQALNKGFPYLKEQLDRHGSRLVGGFFSTLEERVSDAFDSVSKRFDEGQTLQSLVPGSGAAALAAGSTSGGPLSSFESVLYDVQSNWLFEKVESFFEGGVAPPQDGALNAPIARLASACEAAAGGLEQALDGFWSFLGTALTDPKDIATLGVAELLGAAKEVALATLAFLDGIIEALLEVAAAALASVSLVLSAPFEIPFISSIVDDIGGLFGFHLDLGTMADALCLCLAIGVTLVYKAVEGADSEPFPDGALPGTEQANGLGAAADSDPRKAILMTAAAISGVWTALDTGLDVLPDSSSLLTSILDTTFPVLLGVFTWPGGIPFGPIPLDEDEDVASFANWLLGWAGVVINVGYLLAEESKKVARYVDPWGKLVLTAFGAISLIGGVIASALGAKASDIVANILGPLPSLSQFLRLNRLTAGGDASLYAKLAIDFFAGTGTTAAIAASAAGTARAGAL